MTFACKPSLRRLCRKKRLDIPAQRRKESGLLAKQTLRSFFNMHSYVLSYASFADEFDTTWINKHLCASGKLVLPKIEGNSLQIFHVENIDAQTEKHGRIAEPIPHRCEKASSDCISLALIPGLAFDTMGHRLGYGKGFYDRFLPAISPEAKIVGIGFKEQLIKDQLIPVSAHDFPLNEILLF